MVCMNIGKKIRQKNSKMNSEVGEPGCLGPLHYEMIIHILCFLPLKDIFSFVSTRKKNYKIKNTEILWKLLFERDFPWPKPEQDNYIVAYEQYYSTMKELEELIYDPIQNADNIIYNLIVHRHPVILIRKRFPIHFRETDEHGIGEDGYYVEQVYVPVRRIKMVVISRSIDNRILLLGPTSYLGITPPYSVSFFIYDMENGLKESICVANNIPGNKVRETIENFFKEGYCLVKTYLRLSKHKKLIDSSLEKGLIHVV